ncbi:hypothetical protein [Rhodococcus chondri]|uniref:Adenylate cyclase n=1 Tax=Rhodococcus chondri TaxID=3065941 RepID=A0ABU7JL34_9NOCA|nr:hypothetical protein [Rhodococcus sp. CC-R104]MEE2030754.1 hypothetical protein [Rhodococcus sp. CC-R104]
MLELFGVIVVWVTVAIVALGTLFLVVVSTVDEHFLQRKPKKAHLDKTDRGAAVTR